MPPAGAVESFVNVSVVGVVLPAPSAEVTVSVGWLAVPSDQANVFESYGPPTGVESVPGVCVQPVAVPARAAVVLDAMAEPPVSEAVFRIAKLPPEPPLVPR
jgi:hypothetical protein